MKFVLVSYNDFDGVKVGTRLRGDYLKKHHNLDAGLWVNSGVGQSNRYDGDSNNDKVSYSLNYSTSLFKYVKNSRMRFSLKELELYLNDYFEFLKLFL